MTTVRHSKYFAGYLLAIVGLFASVGYMLAKPEVAAPGKIVKLERVMVVGKRAETQAMVQLPRVVVIGRRDARLAKL